MTGSGVERTQRAASRPAHVRLGLRVLAVGGLAGAAWLLSAASAHAAEAQGPIEVVASDLPVVSLVSDPGTGVDEGETGAPDTLGAVLRPVSGVTAVVLPSTTAANSTPVDRVGLTRVTDPVDGELRPVIGVLRSAAKPVTSTLGQVDRTVSDVALAQAGQGALGKAASGGPGGLFALPVAPGVPMPATDPHGLEPADVGAGSTAAHRPYAGAERSLAGSPEARPGSGNLPDGPRPASPRGLLGTGAGMPVNGPAPHLEGGAFAVVPSPVVQSTVATHRLPVTADVVVPRQYAVAPTVSPD